MPNSVLQRLILNVEFGKYRHDKLDGRDHLVVPMVMMVEGVHNGSNGPLLYPGDELAKCVPAWNNKPIVIYHPEGSAADPVVLNTRGAGIVLNTSYDTEKKKQRAEAWLDVVKCNSVDKRVEEAILANRMMEVSTGLYTENEGPAGEWNGEKYDAVARNHQPDHLAILPDILGACSIEDGAGLLQLNASKEGKISDLDRLVVMSRCGLRPLVLNDKSFGQITNELYSLIQARFGYSTYIEAVYPAWFVYCHDGSTYKLSYTQSGKEVTIGDKPVEVVKEEKYVTVNGELVASVTNSKKRGDEAMKTRAERIEALIKNGGWDEADRSILDKFSDEKIEKLAKPLEQTPPVVPPVTENQDKKDKKDPPPATNADKKDPAKPMTWDELTANADAPSKARLALLDSVYAEQKASAIATITANKEQQVYTPAELEAMDLPALQKLAKLAAYNQPKPPQGSTPPSYFGAAIPPTSNNNGGGTPAPYVPPTMNFGKEGAAA